MYSTTGFIKNSRRTGRIAGTHQRLDRVARSILMRNMPKNTFFPTIKEILHFEGMRGPDGLKRKSPGEDEPNHFFIPGEDNSKFLKLLHDHQYNLKVALEAKDSTRAAFEAAWFAHAVADGLTPAHHFPLHDVAEEMMSEQEFIKIFGQPVKGIMRGDTTLETLKKNWAYWGIDGHMSRHIAFEFSIAIIASSVTLKEITPKVKKTEFENLNFEQEFLKSVSYINNLDLYGRFADSGLSQSLAIDVQTKLLPEIARLIAFAWVSALPKKEEK